MDLKKLSIKAQFVYWFTYAQAKVGYDTKTALRYAAQQIRINEAK